jgi:3-hydroxybutyryl-CoA dehydrogenase
MAADAIKTVGVLGAGTMGNGIAHVFAGAGYHVILRDVEMRFLDRGIETISKNLDREVKKGKITEADKPVIVARIKPATDVAALAAADFVVEAVPEQLDLKLRVLKDVDAARRPEAILAINTTSI